MNFIRGSSNVSPSIGLLGIVSGCGSRPNIRLQSLPTTPGLRVCVTGNGESGDIGYSVNRICVLGGLVQEVEVFDLFSSPLQ